MAVSRDCVGDDRLSVTSFMFITEYKEGVGQGLSNLKYFQPQKNGRKMRQFNGFDDPFNEFLQIELMSRGERSSPRLGISLGSRKAAPEHSPQFQLRVLSANDKKSRRDDRRLSARTGAHQQRASCIGPLLSAFNFDFGDSDFGFPAAHPPASWTAPAKRSGDGAFARTRRVPNQPAPSRAQKQLGASQPQTFNCPDS